jgi:hypothetical protein
VCWQVMPCAAGHRVHYNTTGCGVVAGSCTRRLPAAVVTTLKTGLVRLYKLWPSSSTLQQGRCQCAQVACCSNSTVSFARMCSVGACTCLPRGRALPQAVHGIPCTVVLSDIGRSVAVGSSFAVCNAVTAAAGRCWEAAVNLHCIL